MSPARSPQPEHNTGSYRPIGRQQLRRLLIVAIGWLDDPTLHDSEAEQRTAGFLVGLSWGCRYQFRRQRRRARAATWSAVAAAVEQTA